MNVKRIIDDLSTNRDIFYNLLGGSDKELYTWKSSPGRWCLLEIICHLYDEEREDFRSRLMHILENKTGEFPAIDPQKWVSERNYMKQKFSEILAKFLKERDYSLKWLQSLVRPDLSKSYLHPKLGEMKGSLFLASWAAHDYLHIRQILKNKYDYLQQTTGEDLSYAGKW